MFANRIIVFLNTEGVFALVGIVFIYLWFRLQKKSEAIRVILSVIAAGIFSVILKELFDQTRPYIVGNQEPLAGLSGSPAFPSFHTAISFALATNVTFHQKRVGILLMVLASVIGMGRVMSHVHYPVDIMFGIIIGILIGVVVETVAPLPFRRPRNKKI